MLTTGTESITKSWETEHSNPRSSKALRVIEWRPKGKIGHGVKDLSIGIWNWYGQEAIDRRGEFDLECIVGDVDIIDL